MKTQLPKKVCAVSTALFCWYLMLSSNAIAEPTTVQPGASPQSVLSLLYHGAVSTSSRSLSLFFKESGIYVGLMLCSDKARNIYIYDPLSPHQCALKKFNPQGKLLDVWYVEVRDFGGDVSATVLPDGKVWFSLGVGTLAGKNSVLPFVVLQPGQNKPIVDWQQSSPEAVANLLYRSVTPEMWQGMPPSVKADTKTWVITRLNRIKDKVLLNVTNLGGGSAYYPPEANVTKSQKLSWQLLLSGDGKQLIQAKPISEREARTPTLFRSPDGALWHSETDSLTRPRKWTKLWVWKEGQPKGDPLVTRSTLSQPREAWQKLVGTQPERAPTVTVDARGNFYLNWQRKSRKPEQKFTVGTNSWSREPMDEDGGQRALIVLDSNRKFVASVPWTTCYYQVSAEEWVFPAPDGSGFYRSEFGGKAMEIYWHPLPNFKMPSPAKSATAKKGGNTGTQKPKLKR